MNGLYVPGHSPLHCAAPGAKLLALLAAGIGVFLLRDSAALLFLFAGVLGLYALAGLGARTVWAQLKPSLVLLLFFLAVQGLTVGWEAGAVTALRFGVMILLASLLTLTTRTSDLLAALERALRPLARVGVDPERVSLALSLTLRFIPVLAQVVQDVQEAQRARGLERNLVALAAPVIVRTLKMADDVADAIDARS